MLLSYETLLKHHGGVQSVCRYSNMTAISFLEIGNKKNIVYSFHFISFHNISFLAINNWLLIQETVLTLERGGARMNHLQSTASVCKALPSLTICCDSMMPSGPLISNSHATARNKVRAVF